MIRISEEAAAALCAATTFFLSVCALCSAFVFLISNDITAVSRRESPRISKYSRSQKKADLKTLNVQWLDGTECEVKTLELSSTSGSAMSFS